MRGHVVVAVSLVFIAAAALAAPVMTDAEITAAVEAHLLRRLTADAFHAIDVATRDGIVTLSGEVRTLLAGQRAVEVTGAIRGVRAVVDRLRVDPVARPDPDIRNDVVAALRVEPVTDEYELAVEVSGGVVTLRGTVHSAQEREVAARVASAVRGVRGVRNDLSIRYATVRSDAEIEADVRSRLRWDARIDGRAIEVTVRNGSVILSGDVGSVSERVLAVNDAWVTGVRTVTDRLRVVPRGASAQLRGALPVPTEAEIRSAVVQALALDPRVASSNVLVTVRDGIVTLSGTVSGPQARDAAEDDARSVAGVRLVTNLLKVRPAIARPDAEIAADVRRVLGWNAAVDAAEVIVSVRAGIVYLSGRVDSRYERQAAGDAAGRVAGVVGVVNNLAVPDAWPVKSDFAIERDAEAGIVWNAFVDGSDIDVSVTNGVATLTGIVDSVPGAREAEREAFDAGATRVVNRLQVDAVGGGDAASASTPVSWWAGMAAELVMALIVASLFTAAFVWLLRRRGAEQLMAAAVLFFLTVFLATWALGAWVAPRGPTVFGVPWLAFLVIGLIVALVAAAAPPVRRWRVPGAAGAPEPAGVAGPVIWILLAILVLAIIGNEVRERRADLPVRRTPLA